MKRLILIPVLFSTIACSSAINLNQYESQDLQEISTFSAPTSGRFILEHKDFRGVAGEVSKNGGQVVGKMEFFDGVIANLSAF